MQNRCARICTSNFDYNVPSRSLLKQLKWMDIETRYNYYVGILMYKYVNGFITENLCNQFTLVNQSHLHNTRASSSNDICLPLPHTELLKRNLTYSGPALWNSLPLCLRNSCNIISFKRSLKTFLLD